MERSCSSTSALPGTLRFRQRWTRDYRRRISGATSRRVAQRQFGKADGEILLGPPLNGPVTFLETGLRFEADVLRGQKTGFFLDQRENRRQVEALAMFGS